VLILAVVVGGPFVSIHFIEGKAPAPRSLSSRTSTTITGQPAATTITGARHAVSSTVDGTWNIAAGSVTGYRVKETPFGQSNTAVGRTSSITGTITVSSGTLEFLLNPSHA